MPETDARVRVVDALEVDELPLSSITRLYVNLVHDGFGESIRLPVLVARGERPGPVFGLTCALHGNELNGIPVIHRLFRELNVRNLRGTVVAVIVVNVPGFERRERCFSDGRDLNHLFPGKPTGDVSQVYVHRFFERIVSRFDLLVDMHTASTGRINSLYVRADMSRPSVAHMAYLQRPQLIVHNPANDSTLRGAATAHGVPAITIEIGDPQRFQPEMIRNSLIGLRSVLANAGMIARRQVAEGEAPIVCARSYWLYTDHGGLLEVAPRLCQRLSEGEVYARLTSVFGDVSREFRVPEDGVVIGKSVDPVANTGARLIHLGIEAPEGAYVTREQASAALEEYKP